MTDHRVTVMDLVEFEDAFSDLADAAVMDDAWT